MALTIALALGGIFLALMFGFSFFVGGTSSVSLLGWSEIPVLSGVDIFITNVYNTLIIIASWVTISTLFVILISVQVGFIFLYYKIGMLIYQHKDIFEKFIDNITDV